MKTFQYNGPIDTSATLRLADGGELDVIFRRGGTVTVPETHDYIQTLVALGHLAPAEASTGTTQAKASKVSTKEGSE